MNSWVLAEPLDLLVAEWLRMEQEMTVSYSLRSFVIEGRTAALRLGQYPWDFRRR